MKNRDTAEKLPLEMAGILARALDGSVAGVSPRPDGSVTAEIHMRGRTMRLQALWAGEGRPHEVERAIADIGTPWPDQAVVAARHLSPAALELLTKRDANWADATGRARVVGAGVVVIRDEPTKAVETREITWSKSAAHIAETLLARTWPEGVGTSAVAEITGSSPGQVSQVLQKFDAAGWTAKAGPQRGPSARRDLVDADGMLDAWSHHVSSKAVERRIAHGLVGQPLALLDGALGVALGRHVSWALTGWAASEALAPIMTAIPALQVCVASEDFFGPLTDAIRESGLREVDEGGVVEFWRVEPEALRLGDVHAGLPIVSPPRVYADLLRIGGRGEDAALHLRQDVIAPMHADAESG